jgi:hypothetical protein
MSRIRKRACLEHGRKLDLNYLFRQAYVREGSPTGPKSIRWTDSISRQVLYSGYISSNIEGTTNGTIRVEIGGLDQTIGIVSVVRHFGGRQWYFVCPVTGDRASVLWKPLGADRYCSRRAWPRQVAYLSQFGTWIDRAHAGKAKVRAKLLSDGDPDGRRPPPRPKRMRARTYERLAARFEAYQAQLNAGLAALNTRLGLDR